MDTYHRIDVLLSAVEPHRSSVGLRNRVYVSVDHVTEDLIQFPNGVEIVVKNLDSPTHFFAFSLCCCHPSHINVLLSERLRNPQACEYLATEISEGAKEMGFGRRRICMSVQATLTRERIFHVVPSYSPARGASDALLQRLSQERTVHVEGLKDLGLESDTCSICLENFSGPDKNLTQMPCSHVFHRDCVFEWLRQQNSCPLCRGVLHDD